MTDPFLLSSVVLPEELATGIVVGIVGGASALWKRMNTIVDRERDQQRIDRDELLGVHRERTAAQNANNETIATLAQAVTSHMEELPRMVEEGVRRALDKGPHDGT